LKKKSAPKAKPTAKATKTGKKQPAKDASEEQAVGRRASARTTRNARVNYCEKLTNDSQEESELESDF
jgi:hypothetical protein